MIDYKYLVIQLLQLLEDNNIYADDIKTYLKEEGYSDGEIKEMGF